MAGRGHTERGRSTVTRNETIAQQSATQSSVEPPGRPSARARPPSSPSPVNEKSGPKLEKWTLGILNDKETEEVPGTVLLLSSTRNEPLGLEYQQGRNRSSSSMPAQPLSPRRPSVGPKKKTKDGQVILDPQPDDSLNDPLNWPTWRRDSALLTLGFYCMIGGGMTPILAAGFNNVAEDFDVSYSQVALTTGLYMMGMGVGSVIFSPTAILYGKRPVYIGGAVLFVLSSVWCALAPNYAHLATARVFQGISVSPVECLPSATIAEIFFLHERAFRVGIYTLLLLGGKNLIPLVSAVLIDAKGWRWVFWVVAIVVGFGGVLLFFFVPETFWDRTPRPKARRPAAHRTLSNLLHPLHNKTIANDQASLGRAERAAAVEKPLTARQHMLLDQNAHARFEDSLEDEQPAQRDERNPNESSNPVPSIKSASSAPKTAGKDSDAAPMTDGANEGNSSEAVSQGSAPPTAPIQQPAPAALPRKKFKPTGLAMPPTQDPRTFSGPWDGTQNSKPVRLPTGFMPPTGIAHIGHPSPDNDVSVPHLHNLNSPYYVELEKGGDYLSHHEAPEPPHDESKEQEAELARMDTNVTLPGSKYGPSDLEKSRSRSIDEGMQSPKLARYTTELRQSPPKSYVETLRLWNGRLSKSSWFLVALRPFILFAYPSILWSTLVYSLSIGWLIVLSESISDIYKSRDSYNFTSLQAGLVYVSPFVGGILGTAVAGKVSDVIVRYMSRKNGGVYEPEFRLVMAIPVAISTAIGLMGFGWSAEERNAWIVPTVFFGVISFGCSLGSTTAITFCVDSYRQYAGEALVTLNFSKNIFHGLVFSLFFASWLEHEGPKSTFLAIGGIQIACMFLTIPMYIYGKRARMWTVRKGFMEKF
ncbi:major facilitator transporter [Cladophialophora carrionii]|uniref:Major facilitator transporter n=1 Tax=Cladophialophora carrionii TaxID=86049 RepID=A0A1C1CRL1_9EURO|nr:major facilitator transporter [Cladophialophora carrionii]